MTTIAGGAVVGASQLGVTVLTNASSPYTVLTTDEFVQANSTSGNIAVLLPAPSTMSGQTVRVLKSAAGNSVTVDGAQPQYIRAGGKSTLSSNGSQAAWTSDGTFWNNTGAVS